MSAPSRQLGRSVIALIVGFLATVILSIGTDAVMHGIGIFPPLGEPVPGRLLVWATAYRAVYNVVGCYIMARLAPYEPIQHALIGGFIGLLLGALGAVVSWNRGPAFGPHWYPVSLIVLAIPCAWLGGVLALTRRREAAIG